MGSSHLGSGSAPTIQSGKVSVLGHRQTSMGIDRTEAWRKDFGTPSNLVCPEMDRQHIWVPVSATPRGSTANGTLFSCLSDFLGSSFST